MTLSRKVIVCSWPECGLFQGDCWGDSLREHMPACSKPWIHPRHCVLLPQQCWVWASTPPPDLSSTGYGSCFLKNWGIRLVALYAARISWPSFDPWHPTMVSPEPWQDLLLSKEEGVIPEHCWGWFSPMTPSPQTPQKTKGFDDWASYLSVAREASHY